MNSGILIFHLHKMFIIIISYHRKFSRSWTCKRTQKLTSQKIEVVIAIPHPILDIEFTTD